MEPNMSPPNEKSHFAIASLLFVAAVASAQPGTAFTYQGRLETGGNPAQGSFDMRFTLHTVPFGGPIIAGPVCSDNVAVADGLFTTSIDFGSTPFNFFNEPELWEIGRAHV